MSTSTLSRRLITSAVLLMIAAGFLAMRAPQTEAPAESAEHETGAAGQTLPRIHELLAHLPETTRRYNEHLTVLASPWMEGRLPGTRGMQQAMDYVEYWFRIIGLEQVPIDAQGTLSHRQPFELGGQTRFVDQALSARVGERTIEFDKESQFVMTGLGEAGDVSAPLVFVGYSIDNGREGYASFRETDDVEGKIALMLRFEPMDDAGRSRWSQAEGWSPAAGFAGKFRALAERKPAGVIIVNTPGADDERVNTLRFTGRRMIEGVPVFGMTAEAASALVEAADAQGRSLLDLRRIADEEGGVIELDAVVTLGGRIERDPVFAENVVGLLPGRGALAEEIVVMGGHLDHLGYGDFGSRSGPGPLHPGADDNASGSAGILVLAELLARDYAELPAEEPLRTILFIAFSAEESGLNGSNHYVRNPLFPLERHVLMCNFDMIGRMRNDRLSVSGTATGKEMEPWCTAIFERAKREYGLTVVANQGIGGGGSDHRPFFNANIPVLFGIIADFHDDYHTPRDVGDLIDREAAMKAVQLFRELAFGMARLPERFEFDTGAGPMRSQQMRVRFGARSRVVADEPGLEIMDVTPGGTADRAGLLAGDRMLSWNKEPLATREDLVTHLREHEPGDVVQVVILRDGEEQTVFVTLREPPGRD